MYALYLKHLFPIGNCQLDRQEVTSLTDVNVFTGNTPPQETLYNELNANHIMAIVAIVSALAFAIGIIIVIYFLRRDTHGDYLLSL